MNKVEHMLVDTFACVMSESIQLAYSLFEPSGAIYFYRCIPCLRYQSLSTFYHRFYSFTSLHLSCLSAQGHWTESCSSGHIQYCFDMAESSPEVSPSPQPRTSIQLTARQCSSCHHTIVEPQYMFLDFHKRIHSFLQGRHALRWYIPCCVGSSHPVHCLDS